MGEQVRIIAPYHARWPLAHALGVVAAAMSLLALSDEQFAAGGRAQAGS